MTATRTLFSITFKHCGRVHYVNCEQLQTACMVARGVSSRHNIEACVYQGLELVAVYDSRGEMQMGRRPDYDPEA